MMLSGTAVVVGLQLAFTAFLSEMLSSSGSLER